MPYLVCFMYFKEAVPVWIKGTKEELLNTHLLFRCRMKLEKGMILRLSAFDFYKVTVDGKFAGFGPARTARGYARVDEYRLDSFARDTFSVIEIRVAGYHCKSLSTVRQDSMLVCEIEKDGKIFACTGKDGFDCFLDTKRQKVCERYSVQRHFNEIYNLDEKLKPVSVFPLDHSVTFLARNVGYPDVSLCSPEKECRRGTYFFEDTLEKARGNAWSFNPYNEPDYGTFERKDIADRPYRYITHAVQHFAGKTSVYPALLSANEWVRFDFSFLEVGFLRADLDLGRDSDIIVAFSENCEGDSFSFTGMNAQNVIELKAKSPKSISFESFEPYSMKCVAVFVKSGTATVRKVGIRHFAADVSAVIPPAFADKNVEKIYNTALRTYAHNAVDLYTDCPSRERGGWLCDSYFTSQAEYYFFGKSVVEKNFLENFILFENDGLYPDGVIPMVYPADDHQSAKFIPQWSMWFVLETRDYLLKRGHADETPAFRKRISDLLGFLEKYENEDGLLEKLPSWNFVEWSDANTWCQDVNYPTNFLYSAVLDAVSEIYGEEKLSEKAERIREKTKELSFNGEVFVDHAVRLENGTRKNEPDVSEAGQYYACLFGNVDLSDKKYAKLDGYIRNRFENYEGKLCRINAFIGLYLRMDLLHQLHYTDILKKDLYYYYLHMCDKTGTLWEYRDQNRGSLDHGFASYVASLLPND